MFPWRSCNNYMHPLTYQGNEIKDWEMFISILLLAVWKGQCIYCLPHAIVLFIDHQVAALQMREEYINSLPPLMSPTPFNTSMWFLSKTKTFSLHLYQFPCQKLKVTVPYGEHRATCSPRVLLPTPKMLDIGNAGISLAVSPPHYRVCSKIPSKQACEPYQALFDFAI